MHVDGNVALITGAASGLGEATARYLHEQGAAIVLFDRDEARAEAVATDLGPRAVAVTGDASREDDVARAVSAAERLGDLRIAVLCAGGAPFSERLLSREGAPHDLQRFIDVIELNIVTTFNAMRLAAAAMSKLDPANEDGERGVVITTSSIAAYEGQIGQLAYGTAKAGIAGMTLIAARDLAAAGVRVNSIAPGTIHTRAWDQAPDGLREQLEAKVPFPRRLGRPEEFAALVEHVVLNGYVNGHVVRLDGAIRFDPK